VEESGRLFVWGNAAYAFGACLTNAFAKYHWCTRIQGSQGGGLVEGLPTWTFKTDEGELARKCSVEVAFTDRREKELADLGFIPLVPCVGTDYAAFFPSLRASGLISMTPTGQAQTLVWQLSCSA
jgi:type VI secretion system protein ImpC